jgi:hypothetical protein
MADCTKRIGPVRVAIAFAVALAASSMSAPLGAQVASASAPQSPVFLSPRGAVAASINTAEKAVTLSIIGSPRVENLPGNVWLGLTATGVAQSGFAGLFSGDDVARDAEVRGTLGYRFAGPRGPAATQALVRAVESIEARQGLRPTNDSAARQRREEERERLLQQLADAGWLGIAAGGAITVDVYGRSSDYRIADSTGPAQVSLRDEKFRGVGASLGLGVWAANLFNVRVVGGASVGAERGSNAAELTEVRVDEVRSTNAPAGGPSVSVTRERPALYGSYATFTQVPVTFDLLLAPIAVPDVALHAFTRTPIRSDVPDPTRISVALYLLKDRNPLTPQAGLVFRWDDAFRKTQRTQPRFSVGVLLNAVVPRTGP